MWLSQLRLQHRKSKRWLQLQQCLASVLRRVRVLRVHRWLPLAQLLVVAPASVVVGVPFRGLPALAEQWRGLQWYRERMLGRQRGVAPPPT
jgi:hypothetical protein